MRGCGCRGRLPDAAALPGCPCRTCGGVRFHASMAVAMSPSRVGPTADFGLRTQGGAGAVGMGSFLCSGFAPCFRRRRRFQKSLPSLIPVAWEWWQLWATARHVSLSTVPVLLARPRCVSRTAAVSSGPKQRSRCAARCGTGAGVDKPPSAAPSPLAYRSWAFQQVDSSGKPAEEVGTAAPRSFAQNAG